MPYVSEEDENRIAMAGLTVREARILMKMRIKIPNWGSHTGYVSGNNDITVFYNSFTDKCMNLDYRPDSVQMNEMLRRKYKPTRNLKPIF